MKAGLTPLASRLRRRGRRGAALFDALLAMALLAVVATGFILWQDSRRQADVVEEAGRQVAILGHAAAHYAWANYAATGGTVWPANGRLTRDMLAAGKGILPEKFPETDAMRRDLRVWYRRVGSSPDRIQVLAGQGGFAATDTRTAHRALFASRGRVHLGLVRRTGCPTGLTAPCLVGPTVAESLAAPFNDAWVREGSVMAFHEITREEYCGDFVLRETSTICPDSARIGPRRPLPGADGVEGTADDVPRPVDLDMGNNALEKVGTMTVGASGAEDDVHEVVIRGDMKGTTGAVNIGGPSARQGAIVVDSKAEVRNDMVVRGGLAIYGNVEAAKDLEVRSEFILHGNLDVSGKVDAGNVRAAEMTIDADEVDGEALNTRELHVDGCVGCTR